MEAKKFLQDSAANATMHGFGRIFFTKSRPQRIVWFLFMTLFLALLIFYIIPVLKRYFSNPSLVIEETIVESKMPFPAITICGAGISKSKLDDFGKTHNKSFDIKGDMDGISYSRFSRDQYILDELGTVESLSGISSDKGKLFLKNLSESCTIKTYKQCNFTTDMESVLVVERGYCHKINPNGTYYQTRPGPIQALSVTFFLNTSDKVPWLSADNGDSLEAIIQYHYEYPFVSAGSVLLPVGQATQIEIKKTEVERLPSPFPSKCTNGENMPPLVFPGVYTTTNCQESCLTREIAKSCNSTDFFTKAFLPNVVKKPLRGNENDSYCPGTVFEHMEKTNYARCKCLLPCFETKFHKTISYSKWPSVVDLPIYRKLFSKALGINSTQMTDEYVQSNFIRMNVFFGDMTYRKVKETKMYTFDKLISEIGGLMGIWVGASMFSLLELVYLFAQTLQLVFGQKQEKAGGVTIHNLDVVS